MRGYQPTPGTASSYSPGAETTPSTAGDPPHAGSAARGPMPVSTDEALELLADYQLLDEVNRGFVKKLARVLAHSKR